MKTFVIDSANCIKAYASNQIPRQQPDSTPFATEQEFASVSADWPALRLIAIWNNLPGIKPVRKFTNRAIALRRIWAAIQPLAPGARSKAELVIRMINSSAGATLKEIMTATGWQAHSVRGFLSAHPKKLGFRVESFERKGERAYRIR